MGAADLVDAARHALGAFTALLRTLVSLHLELARAEAEEEARRLQTALLLMAVAALLFSATILLSQAGLVILLHGVGIKWWVAAFGVAGGDLLLGVACLAIAGRRLQGAWLPRTRERVAETLRTLSGDPV